MPDRIIRDELFESDRWLDLHNDTQRLSYMGLLVCKADDFGNFEGGPRRIFRFLHSFSQVKTDTEATAIMTALVDADLARRYEVDGREFWHLPRTRTHAWKNYMVRKVPPSPWCNPESRLGKDVRRVYKQGLAKNLPVTSPQNTSDVSHVVVLEVDVEKRKQQGKGGSGGKTKNAKKLGAGAPFCLPEWIPQKHWDAWVEARTKARKPPTLYAKKLAVMKLEHLREEGNEPAQVLMQSAFNNWGGLFPLKT